MRPQRLGALLGVGMLGEVGTLVLCSYSAPSCWSLAWPLPSLFSSPFGNSPCSEVSFVVLLGSVPALPASVSLLLL